MSESDHLAQWLENPSSKASIAGALTEGRDRTWLLVDGLNDADYVDAATDYLSPPAWDMGHIANFEERWLVQALQNRPELHAGDNARYNAFNTPRSQRPKLDLLDRHGARTYLEEVRKLTLAGLEQVAFDDRLTKDGFVYWMLILHEHQHQETLLQSIAMRPDYQPQSTRELPAGNPAAMGWKNVGGPTRLGADQTAGVYDNEAPAHDAMLEPYQLAITPVTCGQYVPFVEAGYDEPEHWSPRGWKWRQEHPPHPLNWELDGTWYRRSPLGRQAISAVANEILCHVSYFEAEAFARWSGARLPTEAEWEAAARGPGRAPARNPWGNRPATTADANVDQLAWHPSEAGAYPAHHGLHQMIGDVWEWTESDFRAYPGTEAYPYDEYSKVFYDGDYKVLRGGSWATRAGCANGTFRNWDHPYRQQIFAGIRLARDA